MEIIISLFVSLITALAKKFGLKDKFGGLGVHIFLLALALLYSAFQYSFKWLPVAYITSATEIWAGAVLIYEFLYKTIFEKIIKNK